MVILIAPPKIGSEYLSNAFVQFKNAEKYAFPISKNIIQTKMFAKRKKSIGGDSGIKTASRKERKIVNAEIKISEICKRVGSSF
jgi:hypothetical protein